MRMEGPQPNVVPFENPAVGAARRFAEAEISELKNEINSQLDELHNNIREEQRGEFEREAVILQKKIESDTKQVQNNFLANMLNAQNIRNEVEKTKRVLFLHNNLRSHLIFIRTNIPSKFWEKWRGEQEEKKLAA